MKKIMFISTIPGNMEELVSYYNLNFKYKYDIEVMNCYKFYKNRILGKFYKLKYILKKYDLVIADYPTELLKLGRKSIYMDHGSGLKLMPGKDEICKEKVKRLVKAIEEVDYFIIQSEREKDILYTWVPYTNKEKYNFKKLGQPRNDKLFQDYYKKSAKNYIYKKYCISDNEKLILLAPTWRGYEIDNKLFNKNDMNILNEYLEKNNLTLVYRPHYIEDIFNRELFNNLSKCIVIDNKSENDAQRVLAATDVLITDYSGILTEFLALNKPIMFLDIDVERYENVRGLAIDYYNDVQTPGPKIRSINDILDYLNEIINNNDIYIDKRKEAIDYYYTDYDGKSSERVWELIETILDK